MLPPMINKDRLVVEAVSDFGPLMSNRDSSVVMEFSPQVEKNAKQVRLVRRTRSLGMWAVVSITYFYGCGGPIGTEPLVSTGGPLIAIVTMLAYPLFMTLPYAWVVAELCSAFPEDGGFVIWVLHAFGPFWARQVGYWSWVAGLIVGAMIPSLLINLIAIYFNIVIDSALLVYIIRVSIAVVLTIPTLLGTKCVSAISIAMLLLTLGPFLLFTVWAYAKAHNAGVLGDVLQTNTTWVTDTNEVYTSGSVDIAWTDLINTLFWNYDGINIASVFGGEVLNPARVYSKAILITVVLSVLSVVLPIPAAIVGGNTAWPTFDQGTYMIVAQQIGGEFLEFMVVVSAISTTVGLYVSSIYCKAFEMSGMAESHLVPLPFAKRNRRFGSPHVSIIISIVFIAVFSIVDFTELLPMSNVFACAVQLTTLLASIRLRMTLPFIMRPTKVRGGIPMLMVATGFACVTFGFLTYTALRSSERALLLAACLLPGLLYGAYEHFRQRTESVQI